MVGIVNVRRCTDELRAAGWTDETLGQYEILQGWREDELGVELRRLRREIIDCKLAAGVLEETWRVLERVLREKHGAAG